MPEETALRPSRKGKEREQRELAPTDLAERLIAMQRRTAAATRPKERSERNPPPTFGPRDIPALPATSRPLAEKRPLEKFSSSSTARPSPAQTSPTRKHAQVSPPRVMISHPSADHEDFARRLKISSSPRSSPHQEPAHNITTKKLFNPNTDVIPMRRTAEPESLSDTHSNSSYVHASRGSPHTREAPVHRQLFDHRKDDPVRFSVLARPSGGPGPNGRPTPTPKSSGDYVSASSTSSYAHSLASSSFTLSSSTTDGSSNASALFDQGSKPSHESNGSSNAFSAQLKKLYKQIAELEAKITSEDGDGPNADERVPRIGPSRPNGVVLKARADKEVKETDEEAENEKWKKVIETHRLLSETIHNLLAITLSPSVPASLRNIPQKYNLILRLWTNGVHKLLENLRRSSWQSVIAFEHLQEFIYYAYTFYTGLLEEQNLSTYKSSWLEALGDLARYRMVVTDMARKVPHAQGYQQALTANAVSQVAVKDDSAPASKSKASISDKAAARIDDSSSPSIGVVAARAMNVEPEKERWRGIAREWYATALAERPGEGKLHHHMGLLCREVESEELRGVYHFVKGMTTLHPFQTSRESVLPVWSPAAQARRSHPDARVPDLFVLLQGMLFTNIQLDDFQKTLDRFIERLELDGAEEREWIMMAVVNIGSVLEYGRPGGVLRKEGVLGLAGSGAPAAAMKVKLAKKEDESDDKKMDVDEEYEDADGDREMKSPIVTAIQASPAISEASATSQTPELPLAFKLALHLTFSMLTYTLRKPTRKTSPFARSTLNPYITVILTFLATVLRHDSILAVMQRAVPWEELANFFNDAHLREVVAHEERTKWVMLTSGRRPLSEDWCVRGMEWVGRKVFERGFWTKNPEDDAKYVELDVLEKRDAGEDATDGVIEDEDDENGTRNKMTSEHCQRWVRVARAGTSIAKCVEGFGKVGGSTDWQVRGLLADKVMRWKEEDREEREEEERRRRGTMWGDDDSMDIDDDGMSGDESDEESDEDGDDTEEIKSLKARRRYLRSLLLSAQRGDVSPVRRPPQPRTPRKPKAAAQTLPSLHVVPSYSVLVVDTNILLSSLSIFQSLVESLRWTLVVPLPVIMELDGLSSASNAPALSAAASAALSYITSHLRSHSTSLKVLTSKGNYLNTISIRSEEIDFTDRDSWERNMDDLILRATIWQDEHWVDRSALLKAAVSLDDKQHGVKVVLLSFDRNLRLKARARQLHAANEKDLASIFAMSSS